MLPFAYVAHDCDTHGGHAGTSLGSSADRCEVHFGPEAERAGDRRRLLVSLGLTGAILVAEVVGGFLAGSLALLSDAGHMLTDLSAQVVSLLALLVAVRPADARRTFGFYRLEILAALVNGAALLVLAGFIAWNAFGRLEAPPRVDARLMLPFAAVGLGANLFAAWLLHGARSLNVRGAYLHLLSDTLSSVAVVIGGALMAWRDGLWIIDPVLGLAIAVFVVLGAFRLLREATDVLLEAVPAGIDIARVRDDVRSIDGIEDVHDLHIWTISSGLHALSAHLVVPKGSESAGNDELLTRVKGMLHARHRISHSTLQIESTEYEHVGSVQ